MQIDAFLRTIQIRVPRLAWFLGAGASAAGGIPTAGSMIWDFKRLLYCSAQRKPIDSCADLNDPVLQQRLQRYFDTLGTFPPLGADDEYAAYFEAAYPAEADRRRYLEDAMLRGRPSFGHLALAAFMATDRVRAAWTTNFDRLPEDAAALVFGTSARLTVAAIETADIALDALNEGRWPFLGKLHGDFQSRRLKNTPDELRRQDARLRRALVDTCRRFGLVVAGYSGRDASVMDTLEEGIDEGRGYPAGLFWLHRGEAPVSPRVARLIERASAAGVDAHVVPIATFEELMADVLKMLPALPRELQAIVDQRTQRLTEAPLTPRAGGWPVVRLNALRIDPAPASCRVVNCDIGGTRDVREAVQRSGAALVVARRQVGVLTFGSDAEVRRAFEEYTISTLDLHPLDSARLGFDSAELGLLYDALVRAIARERPLLTVRRGNTHLAYVDRARVADPVLKPLRDAVTSLSGKVPGTAIEWVEAIRLRLEYRFEALWLLIEPTLWVDAALDRALTERAADFIRDRVAGRYNATTNEVLAAWSAVLTAGADRSDLRAFGIGDGVDATFTIHAATAYTHRLARNRAPPQAGR